MYRSVIIRIYSTKALVSLMLCDAMQSADARESNTEDDDDDDRSLETTDDDASNLSWIGQEIKKLSCRMRRLAIARDAVSVCCSVSFPRPSKHEEWNIFQQVALGY